MSSVLTWQTCLVVLDIASVRLLFRQIFRVATLKSGLRKPYTNGFTNEAMAIVYSEIIGKTVGTMSNRPKTRRAVVI